MLCGDPIYPLGIQYLIQREARVPKKIAPNFTHLRNTSYFSIKSTLHTSKLFLYLLLFRHSAESLIAQEERLATSRELVPRLHLPHAKVEGLHAHEVGVNVLTPEKAG